MAFQNLNLPYFNTFQWTFLLFVDYWWLPELSCSSTSSRWQLKIFPGMRDELSWKEDTLSSRRIRTFLPSGGQSFSSLKSDSFNIHILWIHSFNILQMQYKGTEKHLEEKYFFTLYQSMNKTNTCSYWVINNHQRAVSVTK